jgi:hypothetical protein
LHGKIFAKFKEGQKGMVPNEEGAGLTLNWLYPLPYPYPIRFLTLLFAYHQEG